MVFSTTNLFRGIQCPEGSRCSLTHCIFGHELQPQKTRPVAAESRVEGLAVKERSNGSGIDASNGPPVKKRKVVYASQAERPLSRADQIRNELAAVRSKQAGEANRPGDVPVAARQHSDSGAITTLSRSISPPTTVATKSSTLPSPAVQTQVSGNQQARNTAIVPAIKADVKPEPLNPRLIPNDPAGHAKRSLYIKHLHAETSRLNKAASASVPADLKGQLPLSEQMVIKIVLDEEEKIAREQPSVYGNIIKQRLTQLKKITVEDWVKQVRTLLPSAAPPAAPSDEKPIDTRMELDQEVLILPHLVADQSKLSEFEYIPTPPSDESIAAAKAGVEQSKNYEECDRCAARFQVFPDRNEEGLIASNGPCRYHPNRKVYPPRLKTDKETGSKPPYYPCCMEAVGMPGCTLHEDHVFKTSSPGRLAAVLPFIVTPENHSVAQDRDGKTVKAVSYDCEMGYTTFGMELIRLTAVTWPDNKELLDVLVRPLGTVIDLNSRFSGVFPEHYQDAIPYDEWRKKRLEQTATTGHSTAVDSKTVSLPIVESPQRARALLCSFLTPQTPLIGHAINNDLNATRLCHPTIVDTVVLFPHPRGLPMRLGLKALSLRLLNRRIQTAGANGHDSKEDAITSGDLVRVKVGEKWRQMRATGWTLVDGKLVPPPVFEKKGTSEQADQENTNDLVAAGHKRKRSDDGSEIRTA